MFRFAFPPLPGCAAHAPSPQPGRGSRFGV